MSDRHLELAPPPDDPGPPSLPHDDDAERQALGAMLTGDREALDAVTTRITGADYYHPRHELIHDACVHLYARGTTPDPVAVADRLRTTKQLARAGGAAYLHELYQGLVVASNADYHADTIAELATRRRAISALDAAKARLLTPSDDTTTSLVDTLRATLDGIPTGVPGVDDAHGETLGESIDDFLHGEDDPYDWLIPDLLERTDRLILTAGEGHGKALALDTPILTDRGWTTMGDVRVGDHVYRPDGAPVAVIAATDVMSGRPCYRVTFSDGEQIIADAEHLWLTETYHSRNRTAQQARRGDTRSRGTDQRHKRTYFPAVVTTQGIHDTLWARGGHTLNHSIPTTAPLQYPAQQLPVDPYVLGAWLGDGHTDGGRITSADPQILDEIRAASYEVRQSTCQTAKYLHGITGLKVQLRALGVLGDKHVPATYLTGSIDQRIALLQGLMDTDGTVDRHGRCEFSVTNEQLTDDVHELLLGLGVKVTKLQSDAVLNGRVIGPRWRLAFTTDLPAFRLARKAERLTPRTTARHRLRYITAVEPVESVPVRCIQVDHEDGMYLAGRALIPTHNSTFLRQLAVQSAAGIHPVTGVTMTPVKVLLLDLENSRRQTRRKIRPLRAAAGHHLDPSNLVIHVRIQGINLNDPVDVAWLDQLVTKHAPDLLITGPIYKMADGDPNDERESKPVVYALDALRAKHDLTIVLEAHTKKAETADGKKRAKDPVGWSGWRRWPEFGLHLAEDGTLTHWRGARDERTWPHQLNRGGPWPFMPEITIKDRHLSLIKECIQQHGRIPSEREMSNMTNIPRTTLQRLLKEHAAELNTIQYWAQTEGENQP